LLGNSLGAVGGSTSNKGGERNAAREGRIALTHSLNIKLMNAKGKGPETESKTTQRSDQKKKIKANTQHNKINNKGKLARAQKWLYGVGMNWQLLFFYSLFLI